MNSLANIISTYSNSVCYFFLLWLNNKHQPFAGRDCSLVYMEEYFLLSNELRKTCKQLICCIYVWLRNSIVEEVWIVRVWWRFNYHTIAVVRRWLGGEARSCDREIWWWDNNFDNFVCYYSGILFVIALGTTNHHHIRNRTDCTRP